MSLSSLFAPRCPAALAGAGLVAAALLVSAPAGAEPQFRAGTSIEAFALGTLGGSFTAPTPINHFVQQATPTGAVPSAYAHAVGGTELTGLVTGYGEADVGRLHASASATLQAVSAAGAGQLQSGQIRLHSRSSAVDDVRLVVPGLATGALVYGTAWIDITGSLSTQFDFATRPSNSPYAVATLLAELHIADSTDWTRGGSLSQTVTCSENILGNTCPAAAPGLVPLNFSFANGAAGTINLVAQTRATVYLWQFDAGSALVGSLADMSHTLAWAGIGELRDATGALITDYSLRSAATGMDYRYAVTPVPEPATGVLLIAGGALLWRRARRAAR